MRDFAYEAMVQKLLSLELLQQLTAIHECKGRQDLFLEANRDELQPLAEVALIQSTGASNRIEGIFTSDQRLKELVSHKAEPHNRSEQEIAGYREVLATIHESYPTFLCLHGSSCSCTGIYILFQEAVKGAVIRTRTI